MNQRNFLRCVLSTSYLGLMLWILLLAVLFTLHRPTGWRDLGRHAGFMAALALMFAVVGNRGLIRNSAQFAGYMEPVIPLGLKLVFDLTSSDPSPTQVFWDTGQGINGADSHRTELAAHPHLQHVRFPLPRTQLQELRYDPRDNPGNVRIRGIRLVDAGQRTRAVLPLDAFTAVRDVSRLETANGFLHVTTTPEGDDPILSLKPEVLEIINRAIGADSQR